MDALSSDELALQGMSFDGRVLRRGFWLYYWLISDRARTLVYVGRTGDNSSPNAGSPFLRIGQHLDSRANAKANALLKQLRKRSVDPAECKFTMRALGPIFPEQRSMPEHIPYRDRMAALECAVARWFRDHGFEVMGDHRCRKSVDRDLLARVLESIKTDGAIEERLGKA